MIINCTWKIKHSLMEKLEYFILKYLNNFHIRKFWSYLTWKYWKCDIKTCLLFQVKYISLFFKNIYRQKRVMCPQCHAGFNHGVSQCFLCALLMLDVLQFNFNKAVNFALPDRLRYGQDCVRCYQEHKKPPVFSHDKLLITITQQSHSIQMAIW